MTICSAVFIWYWNVTDGQTDRQICYVNIARRISMLTRDKNEVSSKYWQERSHQRIMSRWMWHVNARFLTKIHRNLWRPFTVMLKLRWYHFSTLYVYYERINGCYGTSCRPVHTNKSISKRYWHICDMQSHELCRPNENWVFAEYLLGLYVSPGKSACLSFYAFSLQNITNRKLTPKQRKQSLNQINITLRENRSTRAGFSSWEAWGQPNIDCGQCRI